MLKIIGIIVYGAIVISTGIEMYQDRTIEEKKDWVNDIAIAVLVLIWPITIIADIIHERYKKTKQESKEEA